MTQSYIIVYRTLEIGVSIVLKMKNIRNYTIMILVVLLYVAGEVKYTSAHPFHDQNGCHTDRTCH